MWRWPRVRETRSRGCRRVRFAAAKCKERETNAMNVPIPLQDTGRQLDFKLTTYVHPSGLQLSNLGWGSAPDACFQPCTMLRRLGIIKPVCANDSRPRPPFPRSTMQLAHFAEQSHISPFYICGVSFSTATGNLAIGRNKRSA